MHYFFFVIFIYFVGWEPNALLPSLYFSSFLSLFFFYLEKVSYVKILSLSFILLDLNLSLPS